MKYSTPTLDINLKKPISGNKLANELKKHDIYLTATQYEPGAMHYVEGLSCGLPVLYCINGGGAHEVCKMAGEEFHDIKTMLEKMELMASLQSKSQLLLHMI